MQRCLRLNGFTLDLERGELCAPDGQEVALRAQALAVLLELGRRPGQLVTKRELLARVWPGVEVTDDSLVQCVVEIRRALGDERQRVVRTLPRRGYLLFADADADAAAQARAPADAAAQVSAGTDAAAQADAVPAPGVAELRRWRVRPGVAALCAAGAALSVAALLILHGSTTSGGRVASSAKPSIAVLPLRTPPGSAPGTPHAEDGEGLAFMIAAQLARNPELRVASTQLARDLAGSERSARKLDHRTGIDFVIDGILLRDGDRLGIELQLIDTRDQRIAWSGKFAPTAGELPQAMGALVEQVGNSLGAVVGAVRAAIELERAPASLDVHSRVLRAIAVLDRTNAEGLRRARSELEVAVQLDPRYAPAWAYLGTVKAVAIQSRNDPALGPGDLARAVDDTRRAVELEPGSPLGWRQLSVVIDSGEGPAQAAQAVRAAERAVELAPGDADNWLMLALAQHHSGDHDASRASLQKAQAWQPLRLPHYAVTEARIRYAAGEYERALRAARDCIDQTSVLVVCKALWLSSLMRLDRESDARDAWPAMVAQSPFLPSYRLRPPTTPSARQLDEDLSRLRGMSPGTRTAADSPGAAAPR